MVFMGWIGRRLVQRASINRTATAVVRTGLAFQDDRRVETDWAELHVYDILKHDTTTGGIEWSGEPTGGYDRVV